MRPFSLVDIFYAFTFYKTDVGMCIFIQYLNNSTKRMIRTNTMFKVALGLSTWFFISVIVTTVGGAKRGWDGGRDGWSLTAKS